MPIIPIQLSALPVPVQIQAVDVNSLLQIIAQYIAASIGADVSFFQQGSNWPLSDQGIYFNQTTNQFGTWSTAQGKYLPVTDLTIGDLKASFVAGDNTADGWIQLDGRLIDAVTGITNDQKSALQALFGALPSSALPNYTFVTGLSGLPANGSYTGINNPTPSPTQDAVSALTIGGTYDQNEVQAVRDALASLAGSTLTISTAVGQIIGYSESVLNALNGGGVAGPKWFVYVGSQ